MTPEEHLACAELAFDEASKFFTDRAQQRSVMHILFAIHGLMHEFNERDKHVRGNY